MTYRNDITASELRKLLHYCPQSGNFTWLTRGGDDRLTNSWNARYAGTIAGSVNKKHGYRYISIDGRLYLAHRLAFLNMTGALPRDDVDHVNLDRSDNRWINLREATQSQNQANTRKPRGNTSGWKGASRNGSRWQAQIGVNGKQIYLGRFRTPEEAHAAYCEAAVKYYGDFART
ncbi:MAG: HNH endonuclease [Beijerinckiaceae bacterium]|nr:HNH endonuclease [Beijerinckiaceae bacterium]